MITFRHFLDKPLWAAAAGYKFNYMDCMSCCAWAYGGIVSALCKTAGAFLVQEVRELPTYLLAIVLLTISAISWPLIFWLAAILLWFKCWKYQKKYQAERSEIFKRNIADWLEECERKWDREKKCS